MTSPANTSVKIPTLDEGGKYLGSTIWNRGFIAMCITQFTVALNDNMFRWLIVPIGKAYADEDLIRTLGGLFLLVPFLLLASIAGFTTDRFSKRNVMLWCKGTEAILLVVAIFVLCMGPMVDPETGVKVGILGTAKIPLLLIILFGLGSQAAFFSPSKYGSIPDLVPENKLSEANGVIAMTTMMACVLGQILGGYIFFWTSVFKPIGSKQSGIEVMRNEPFGIPGAENWWIAALFLVGTAVIGLVASYFVPRLKPNNAAAKFPKNPIFQTGKDIAELFSYRKLYWVSIASAFFWGLAGLAALNIDKFREVLNVDQQNISNLAAILSIGIGAGAVLCGIWSRGRIEMGLVPIGAFGIGFFLFLLGFTPVVPKMDGGTASSIYTFSYAYAAITLILTGVAAGLFDIPLAAYIQHNCPEDRRGRLLAAYNFFSFTGMILFTIGFLAIAKTFDFLDSQGIVSYPPSLAIWFFSSLIVFAVCGILVYELFVPLLNLSFTFLLWLLYRPKVFGTENIPKKGGAIFVCNHVSFLDGPLVYTSVEKGVRLFAHVDYIPGKFFNYLADRARVIRVLPGKKVVRAIKEAREGLKNGDFLCIFPEGGITRTGQIKAFEPGFLSMLKGDEDVPVIPVYLGGIFGSMFSYAFGTKLKFKPRHLKQHVVVAFGKPIYHPNSAAQVQRAVEELGVETMRKCGKELPVPPRAMLDALLKKGDTTLLSDAQGTELSGREFLRKTFLLRQKLRRDILADDETNIGLLLPSSIDAYLVSAALASDRRTAVNLDPTFSNEALEHCIKTTGVRQVLTTRKLLKRFPNLKIAAKLVYLEDLLPESTASSEAGNALPSERTLGLTKIAPEDPIAIFFELGAEELPKPITLSHKNVAEQVRSLVDLFRITDKDTLLDAASLAEPNGYLGMWLTLLGSGSGALHDDPTEFERIGELAKKRRCTFFPTTPEFLERALSHCPKECFESIDTVLCTGKPLSGELTDAWEKRYGVRPVQGYGKTAATFCVAANLPDCRIQDTFNKYRKDGSMGRAIPNVAIKIVDSQTGVDLETGEIGTILVKGPTVIPESSEQPGKTDLAQQSDWLSTGDLGKLDENGFLWLS